MRNCKGQALSGELVLMDKICDTKILILGSFPWRCPAPGDKQGTGTLQTCSLARHMSPCTTSLLIHVLLSLTAKHLLLTEQNLPWRFDFFLDLAHQNGFKPIDFNGLELVFKLVWEEELFNSSYQLLDIISMLRYVLNFYEEKCSPGQLFFFAKCSVFLSYERKIFHISYGRFDIVGTENKMQLEFLSISEWQWIWLQKYLRKCPKNLHIC